MKVLFLDHDGVICLANNWGNRFKQKQDSIDSVFDSFDKKAIKVLNKIIEVTNCEIVVSSDWKLFCTLEQMQELYRIRGIIKSPIDYTPNIDPSKIRRILGHIRVHEIGTWLIHHPEVTHWVAVDDLDLSSLTYFVHTPKSTEGIKQTGVYEKIIKILN